MKDNDYFSHLYKIASHLNKEFTLHAALSKALEKTAEILDIETGWIWLMGPDDRSVYLAASHNLPPALKNRPERLSGWCYCINQYLSDDIDQAMNISEIACSRLKDISSGTKGLKFHATIPINVYGKKAGLMNLLSKETRKLSEKELTILNTISELVGTAIQRTRLQQSHQRQNSDSESITNKIIKSELLPKIEGIISNLAGTENAEIKVKKAHKNTLDLKEHLSNLIDEVGNVQSSETSKKEINYPNTPLTKRELEVLDLIQKGHTNEQIGKQLFITERTVKFHITSILSKFDADNRTEAVNIALKMGLLGI